MKNPLPHCAVVVFKEVVIYEFLFKALKEFSVTEIEMFKAGGLY
jgi:hypothetical protein